MSRPRPLFSTLPTLTRLSVCIPKINTCIRDDYIARRRITIIKPEQSSATPCFNFDEVTPDEPPKSDVPYHTIGRCCMTRRLCVGFATPNHRRRRRMSIRPVSRPSPCLYPERCMYKRSINGWHPSWSRPSTRMPPLQIRANLRRPITTISSKYFDSRASFPSGSSLFKYHPIVPKAATSSVST